MQKGKCNLYGIWIDEDENAGVIASLSIANVSPHLWEMTTGHLIGEKTKLVDSLDFYRKLSWPSGRLVSCSTV